MDLSTGDISEAVSRLGAAIGAGPRKNVIIASEALAKDAAAKMGLECKKIPV
jgi:hypothetical protein